jgi:epoxyqueuosine reductase
VIGLLARALEAKAAEIGLAGIGISPASPSAHGSFYRSWLERGFHGEMRYLSRGGAVTRRQDLELTLEGVRSVVVVAQEYFQEDSPGVPEDPGRGVVARYARGEDYHDHLKARLDELLQWLRGEAMALGVAPEVRGVPYVDTGPILEREMAQRAGLGWFGQNTMLIHPRRGSYFFLGLLLLDLELPPSEPFKWDHCGSCRACLDACPTGALLGRNEAGGPVMDARRCISYLTIELKGPVPRALRPALGNRIFGCDICQEVCPWNRKFAEPADEPGYRAGPDTDGPILIDLMRLTDAEFAARFSGSPVKRAGRRGFLRNVAVALGNWLGSLDEPPEEAVAVLVAALDDPEPLVRGHAAWALGRVLARSGALGDWGFAAAAALRVRKRREENPWVREEIGETLVAWDPTEASG